MRILGSASLHQSIPDGDVSLAVVQTPETTTTPLRSRIDAIDGLLYTEPIQVLLGEVDMKERVEQVINRIRPAVQMDGGDIELVDVVDGMVRLRLVGSCHGCPSSMMTLKQGIERAIRAEVPEITGVEAISD